MARGGDLSWQGGAALTGREGVARDGDPSWEEGVVLAGRKGVVRGRQAVLPRRGSNLAMEGAV